MTELADAIRAGLRAAADPERAPKMQDGGTRCHRPEPGIDERADEPHGQQDRERIGRGGEQQQGTPPPEFRND